MYIKNLTKMIWKIETYILILPTFKNKTKNINI